MANDLAMNSTTTSYHEDECHEPESGNESMPKGRAKPTSSVFSATTPTKKSYYDEDSTTASMRSNDDFSPTGSPMRSTDDSPTRRPTPPGTAPRLMVASPTSSSSGPTSNRPPNPTPPAGRAATRRAATVVLATTRPTPHPAPGGPIPPRTKTLAASAPPNALASSIQGGGVPADLAASLASQDPGTLAAVAMMIAQMKNNAANVKKSSATGVVPTKEGGGCPTPRLPSVLDASSDNLQQNAAAANDDEEQGQRDLLAEQGEKQDAEEEEKQRQIVKLLEKGERIVLTNVNEKLTDLPRPHAWAIAATVIICTVTFLIALTMYNMYECQEKMDIIDADWQWEEGDGPHNNNPYKKIYDGSTTRLCLTAGQRKDYLTDTGIVEYYGIDNETSNGDDAIYGRDLYDYPCMLKGFTLADFDEKHCPKLQEIGIEGVNNISDYYDDTVPVDECTGTVSVVYVECQILTVALGSSLGYVAYVQLFLLVMCFILYRILLHDPASSRIERLRSGVQESITMAQEKMAK